MTVAIVTGAGGLIGSQAVRSFASRGLDVVGIDNDMRRYFFGSEGSTAWNRRRLETEIRNYRHCDIDIRDLAALEELFGRYRQDIGVVVHAAAQPSHDWAAREPATDFSINATGTLNLLELTRRYAFDAPFMFMSTNKVYGDRPNDLPLVELDRRWELQADHPYAQHGIDESMPIDQSLHSLFGASKAAADLLVQEYGRYFGMFTACFRGGCLTGPTHSSAELHGFLAYLMKCTLLGNRYTVFGYQAKQVRDNIHASDLVEALWQFFRNPRRGEVYNIGGGRFANCSMREAIKICEAVAGRELDWVYSDANRSGDHIWWISDTRKFGAHYPEWRPRYSIEATIREIHEALRERMEGNGYAKRQGAAKHPGSSVSH